MRINDDEIYKRLKRLHTLDLSSTENDDHQLLFHMAKRGCIKALNLLMECSVPTPWEGSFNVIGDDINRLDQDGHTALYHAVKEGQVKMVKHILKEYQPDLTLKDNDYDTLLNLAEDSIKLELTGYQAHNPTLAIWTLLFSTGVGKQDDNHPNHPGY